MPSTSLDMDKLHRFASDGDSAVNDKATPSEIQEESYELEAVLPWERPEVREDVVKGMGVPLSEPYLLKLRYIAEHTKYSQRKFCQVRLEEAIDREIATLLMGQKHI
jgi:hypothetical protein